MQIVINFCFRLIAQYKKLFKRILVGIATLTIFAVVGIFSFLFWVTEGSYSEEKVTAKLDEKGMIADFADMLWFQKTIKD